MLAEMESESETKNDVSNRQEKQTHTWKTSEKVSANRETDQVIPSATLHARNPYMQKATDESENGYETENVFHETQESENGHGN